MTEHEYTVTESVINDLIAKAQRGPDALYQRLGNGEHVAEAEWERAYRLAYHHLVDDLRVAIIDSIKAGTDEIRREFPL